MGNYPTVPPLPFPSFPTPPTVSDSDSDSDSSQETSEFERFLDALGQRESGNRYRRVNRLGFTGKYQFGEAILIDLGYYQASRYYDGGGNGIEKCFWRGRWRSKAREFGVRDYEDFRNNVGDIQEAIIKDEFRLNTRRMINYFGGKSRFKEHLRDSEYTYSGLLAAAHLQGATGAAELLEDGTERHDEFGTNITEYAEQFSNYDFDLYEFD